MITSSFCDPFVRTTWANTANSCRGTVHCCNKLLQRYSSSQTNCIKLLPSYSSSQTYCNKLQRYSSSHIVLNSCRGTVNHILFDIPGHNFMPLIFQGLTLVRTVPCSTASTSSVSFPVAAPSPRPSSSTSRPQRLRSTGPADSTTQKSLKHQVRIFIMISNTLFIILAVFECTRSETVRN